MKHAKPSPRMVLAAYAERLIEGRRVVVFGDSTSGLAEHLVERGARLVHVYDADIARVAEAATRGASRSISFAPLGQGVAVRDGAFDVGVIENLAEAEDPAGAVRRMRRALAARGIAFITTPNLDVTARMVPDTTKSGPSYYELYDLAGAEFDEIRMLGQSPFVGYAVAEFSENGGDEYSIDTAFVPGGSEEPEYYLALASHFPVSLDSFSVVQLPAESLLARADAGAEASPRIESLKRQVAAVERKLAEAQRREPKADEESKRLLREANDELARRDAWVTELESRAAVADERADDAEAALEPLKIEVSRLKQGLQLARKKSDERASAIERDSAKKQRELELASQGQLREREQQSEEQLKELKLALATAQQSQKQVAELKQALSAAQQGTTEERQTKDQNAARQSALAQKKAETAAREIAELKRALSEAHRELKQLSVAEEEQQEKAAKQKRQQEEQQQQREQATASLAKNDSLAAETEQLKAKVKELLSQLAQSQQQVADSSQENREIALDVMALEAQLQERGHEISRLSVDLSKTENFGEQLLRELEDARATEIGKPEGQATESHVSSTTEPPTTAESKESADLKRMLDELAEANAQHVADLTAAKWTIQELESKLEALGPRGELAADSELEQAKAEIQRQSTLLQQFRDKPQV